jgi:hypothetical protein
MDPNAQYQMVAVGEVKDHPDIMGTTFNQSLD